MERLTRIKPSELSRATEDSAMGPIAYRETLS